jgi:hypothetical protein
MAGAMLLNGADLFFFLFQTPLGGGLWGTRLGGDTLKRNTTVRRPPSDRSGAYIPNAVFGDTAEDTLKSSESTE